MRVLLCPMSDPGFLYPSIAVGLALQRQGADVWVLGAGSAGQPLAEAGLRHVDADTYGGRQSFAAARWFRELPGQYAAIRRVARDIDADVLVTSVLCHGALVAAEVLDLPVVVIGLTAHLWGYAAGGDAEPELPVLREWRTHDMFRLYNRGREQAGFPPCEPDNLGRSLAGTALLLRGDPALEYPGAALPEGMHHHVGPCTWEPAADPAELAEVLGRLDRVDKPVVYVHLGRIFGGTCPWPRLNAAFTGGPFQAVVELGRSDDPRPSPAADLVIVRKPWMGPLIDRSGFVLTSGTSAPVLNALLRGRPLGVSPAGSEQPILAEACVRAGVAVYMPNDLDHDPVDRLRTAWQHDGMRVRARRLGQRLAAADGGERAAKVIQAVLTGAEGGPRRPSGVVSPPHRCTRDRVATTRESIR